MQQIERGIYYEDSYLGVTLGALVFAHGTIMIDAPLRAEDARAWRSSVLNQRGGTNRLLINLDSHPDRTLGARSMDCTVVAHQKTAQAFRNRPTIFKGQSMESGAAWELYPDAIGMRWNAPDITFSERMSLHWGGPEVMIEHHPGPEPGSSWVIIPAEKVIFVGDTVTISQPPFLAYADLEAWEGSLDILLESYRDFTIVSGRDGLATVDDVRKQQRFIKELNKEVEHLAKLNANPEATEDLAPGLLSHFEFPAEQQPRYEQRLRFGLYHYFARRYRSVGPLELPVEESEEQ